MRPRVILHTAVSVDGRIDWFSPDVGGISLRSFFRAPDLISPEGVIPARLSHLERLSGDVV